VWRWRRGGSKGGCRCKARWAAACIARHIASVGEAVDPLVECVSSRHVLEYLCAWVFYEARGIRDNLGKLTPGDEVIRLERTVRVARDDALHARQCTDA
jgi:hypothetical protein